MFTQLDTKTVYSFMDSLMTIEKYVKTAKSMGYTKLGLMDVDNLYGAYTFLETCQKYDIQPILGLETTFLLEENPINLRLIALSTRGYRNLMKVSTRRMSGEKDWITMQEYLTDLAVVVPYFDGADVLDLGCDYYLGVDTQTAHLKLNHPSLPLPTVRYFSSDQLETLQVLHAIRDNLPLNAVLDLPHGQDLKSPAEVATAFPKTCLDRLSALLTDIHYELDASLKLPRFNAGRPAVQELRERTLTGLATKQLTGPAYTARLEHELSVIHEMGFDDYFLIVWDLLRFGRSQGYYMGMGRGSAAGSLVAYALDITGIDPVKHDLLFERFLNRERFSLPDIDIDMPDVYRGEFIRYVRERYGTLHTAQIVTYSTFGAKQAIRDVFKRFGTPEYELTNLTKKISFRDTLSSAYERNASFRQLINSKMAYQKAFEIAKAIEGQPRQTSIHAAGVVMADSDLTNTIPLKRGEEMMVTQYDAHGVEANGLLKMDFLGLRNLTFAQRMQEAVAEKYGHTIQIEAIDLEDEATLKLFASGKTKGIFQFEQPGAMSLLKRVQPTVFEDVVATTSLNRPGASSYADNFVKRKQGQERVDLLDDSIAEILRPTYGIMLYQEQVMQIAQVYAGFTLGKADLLRRAMGKKKADEMHRMQADFLAGAVSLGHTEQAARKLFERMEKFAGYGFNRSHAYAYSALAFQLAYFKAHYPEIFFDIMLNYSSSDYITDALDFGFEVAKLDINTIPYHDKFNGEKIYLGLKTIKGLTRDMAYWLIENRPFHSVEDFITKLPENYQKIPLLTPLIQVGLFDRFEPNRQKILANLNNLFTFAEAFSGLFAESTFSWMEAADYSDAQKYELEQALVGVGISPHPLVKIAETTKVAFTPLADLVENSRATVLVQITDVRVIRTKKTGEPMAFLRVSDGKKQIDVTVFPESYKKFVDSLQVGRQLFITGKVQEREGQLQLLMQEVLTATTEKFWIQMADHAEDSAVARILEQFPGEFPVVLRYEETKETVYTERFRVRRSQALEEKLQNLVMKTIFR